LRSEGGTESRIEALIQPVVTDMGFLLVRIRFTTGGRPKLQIMAERPDGRMSVEDCALLSRALSALLDVEDPIASEYVLEVSSPGLDRPLVRPEDFVRFKGQEAKIELVRLFEGRKRFRGVLGGIELGGAGDAAILEEEGGARFVLPLSLIDEAKLVLTDALIAQALKAQEGGLVEQGAEVDVNEGQVAVPAQKTFGRGARKKRERS
jgi:ribosome maturation factor RimP